MRYGHQNPESDAAGFQCSMFCVTYSMPHGVGFYPQGSWQQWVLLVTAQVQAPVTVSICPVLKQDTKFR